MEINTVEDIPHQVDEIVANHKVTIFAKSHCPYCMKAIKTLEDLNATDLSIQNIENHPYASGIQDYLQKLTGARSVPRVFIGGKFFGGGDDVVAARQSGKLQELLKEAGAL